jgi:hypothetical protein
MDTIVQRHGLLKKHHEQTKELEFKQLANLHKYAFNWEKRNLKLV